MVMGVAAVQEALPVREPLVTILVQWITVGAPPAPVAVLDGAAGTTGTGGGAGATGGTGGGAGKLEGYS